MPTLSPYIFHSLPHLLLDVGGEVGSIQLQRLHQAGMPGQQLQDGSKGATVGTEPITDLAEAGLLRVGTAWSAWHSQATEPGSGGTGGAGSWGQGQAAALTAWKVRLWHCSSAAWVMPRCCRTSSSSSSLHSWNLSHCGEGQRLRVAGRLCQPLPPQL